MNERIKELAEQAGVGPWGITIDKSTEIFQKFAELIVQECSHQVMSTVLLEGDFDSVAEILMHASFQLKQHFGIQQ